MPGDVLVSPSITTTHRYQSTDISPSAGFGGRIDQSLLLYDGQYQAGIT